MFFFIMLPSIVPSFIGQRSYLYTLLYNLLISWPIFLKFDVKVWNGHVTTKLGSGGAAPQCSVCYRVKGHCARIYMCIYMHVYTITSSFLDGLI